MHRLLLCVVSFAVVSLGAEPAWSADHLMKVGEVLVSAGGDDGIQFVELENAANESFSSQYELVVYDPDGLEVGAEPLDIDANTRRFLIATTEAETEFGVTADESLTVALPSPGQACFERVGAPNTRIHCLSWGAVSEVVSGNFGTDSGAEPPDGLSLQRVANDYVVSEPTPGEENAGPAAADAGPDEPVSDAGPGSQDGGFGPDAGAEATSDDGCGCRSTGGGAGTLLALLLPAALMLRRRRR